MKHSEQIKPVSFLKANAAEIARDLSENRGANLIITQNGEPKMVVMGIDSYQKQQETMALLKILALGNKQIETGKFQDSDSFFAEMEMENQQ